jgi:hypothetical protein
MRSLSGVVPTSGILVCLSCRKVLDCDLSDRLRYTRSGWPKCCGEVMSCAAVAKSAARGYASDDTPPEGMSAIGS